MTHRKCLRRGLNSGNLLKTFLKSLLCYTKMNSPIKYVIESLRLSFETKLGSFSCTHAPSVDHLFSYLLQLQSDNNGRYYWME